MQQWKGIQKPRKLECDLTSLTSTYGKFVVEPFERGFGTTIGNSLRRTLLSAIQGAAVVSIKVDGVYHEFSCVRGVVEDTVDIILNIKNLLIKLHSEQPKTIYLRKTLQDGGAVTAADIEADADVEILNPDLHICTLDKGASIDMSMEVKLGRGYVPAERNKDPEYPLGVIPVDSIFSPVKRVNYRIEESQIGKEIDYDRLIMEIWTDGSVVPEDAVAYAAKIIKDHWNVFMNFEDQEEEEEKEPVNDTKSTLHEYFLKSVNELELSVRSYNCLKNAEIRTIGDLVKRTEGEMLRTKNFGRKSLNEIKEILKSMNLGLGMKIDDVEGVKVDSES